MKRAATLCLFFLLLTAGGLFGLDGSDWGVTLDSATTLRHSAELDDQDWGQRVRAAIWGELFWALPDGGRMTVTGEGSYVYSDDRAYLFDIDRLRFSGLFPGATAAQPVVAVDAGRFGFVDATGLILNHTADGVRVGLRQPMAELEFGVAYTGLLLNPSSQIRMSAADLADDGDDDEYFGPRRTLLQITLRLPELPGRQTIVTDVLAQWDLRDEDDGDELFNSQYLTFLGSGPLAPDLYHTTFLTMAGHQQKLGGTSDSWTAMLWGTRLRYLRPDWLGSRIGANFTYASGQKSNNPAGLVTMIDSGIGTVFRPRLSNLMILGTSYALRPWIDSASQSAGNIEFATGIRTFLRAQDDAGLADGGGLLVPLTLEDGKRYLGTEIDIAVRARLLPDAGAALTAGLFLPGAAAEDAEAEFLVRLEVSLGL